MKFICDEVRILLDRMKEHPEDFQYNNDRNNNDWIKVLTDVQQVATLPERIMLWRGCKQAGRAAALRTVTRALLLKESPPVSTRGLLTGGGYNDQITSTALQRGYLPPYPTITQPGYCPPSERQTLAGITRAP